MHLSFRWFGADDPIPLAYIRQIPGMVSVVTALYDAPASQVWPRARLTAIKEQIEAVGLRFEVVESIPVHEDIKLGRPARDAYIDVYCQNLRLLGELDVSVLCYNFMPLFNWFRTDLAMALPDGSTTMAYNHSEIEATPDPWSANLPAYWPLDDSPDELKAAYLSITEEALWQNLAYFLQAIVPVAAEANVRMAMHPDDPPWSIFGLPRILCNEDDLARLLRLVDSPYNGLTFCTGSLGADPTNDLPRMIHRFGDRIHFAHCRNVRRTGERVFYESAHPIEYGDVDLPAVMKALYDVGFEGPLRPDHGRMIWGETGIPGYGLYDRALGAMYLRGLWDGILTGRSAAPHS